MKQIKNPLLRDFFEQLRFAPAQQKINQLRCAERLLAIVEPQKDYPLEFIIFRITGYRPRAATAAKNVPGSELTSDLAAFIFNLSGECTGEVPAQPEKLHTIDKLAQRFSVSQKTISRWRKKGLIAKIFISDHGKKRIGFDEASVNSFVARNEQLVKKASGFTRLGRVEKETILDHARRIAEVSPALNRYHLTQKIAKITGRSRETIRSILVDHDNNNPQKRILKKTSGFIGHKTTTLIYRLYKQGVPIPELMNKFERSRSSIYRIINKRRTRELLNEKIEYIDSEEFLLDNAQTAILTPSLDAFISRQSRTSHKPLLDRQQELELFRAYNYLKYLACLTLAQINKTNPSSRLLKQAEEYLGRTEKIKNIIVESNLRLVINLAAKHSSLAVSTAELISDGNIILMHTVEKFDYTKGYRFSTYASWAIAKNFIRKIPSETGRFDRLSPEDLANIPRDMKLPQIPPLQDLEHAHRSLLKVITENLTPKEQYVILNHYPIGQGITKNKPKTLLQIGQQLGLSKERARQIELTALQKLRQNLSPEQFDLLKG